MAKQTIPLEKYIEASHVFHWAKKRHYELWFTGQTRTRHRRTEHVLNRLVKNGRLNEVWYEGVKNYTDKRHTAEIVHGLACTECLVRLYLSDRQGTVIPERYFKGFGAVPEVGILYPNGTALLLEFSTKRN